MDSKFILHQVPTFFRITLVVLILESYLVSEAERPEELLSRMNPQDLCWTSEDYNPLDDCQVCSGQKHCLLNMTLCLVAIVIYK